MQESKIRLMFLIGVHLFSEEDIKLNGEVFNWRHYIEPVFDESEIVSYFIIPYSVSVLCDARTKTVNLSTWPVDN